ETGGRSLIPASRRPDSSASEGTEFRSGLHASKLHLNCGRAFRSGLDKTLGKEGETPLFSLVRKRSSVRLRLRAPRQTPSGNAFPEGVFVCGPGPAVPAPPPLPFPLLPAVPSGLDVQIFVSDGGGGRRNSSN